jgi:hypothetical protein
VKHHRKSAGIVIGTGTPLHGIEVRGYDQWGCGLKWLRVGKRRPDDILIGSAQSVKGLLRDDQTCFGELSM